MTIPNALSRKPGHGKAGGNSAAQDAAKAKGKKQSARGWRCCGYVVGVLLAAFLVTGLVLYRQYTLDLNVHSFHDGDQVLARKTTSDLNSLLCEAYTVETGTNRAFIFLTNGEAKIMPEYRQEIRLQNTGLNAEIEFDYKGFYLLPGSEIDMRTCMSVFNQQPRINAEVIVIRGDEHFNKWREDGSCHKCVLRVPVPADFLCELNNRILARYVVEHADTYYVIVTRQHRSDDDVAFTADVELKVLKTMYDVSQPKEQCLMTSSCTLNLTYNADDDVVVQFPFHGSTFPGFGTYFITACTLRKTVWLSVFVFVPAGVIGLLLALCCAAGVKEEQKKKARQAKKDASKNVFTLETTENSSLPV